MVGGEFAWVGDKIEVTTLALSRPGHQDAAIMLCCGSHYYLVMDRVSRPRGVEALGGIS